MRATRCLLLSNQMVQKQARKVAIAMSGGIDSSVAAWLLKQQGYDCVGVFMKNWDGVDEHGKGAACTSDMDRSHMLEVCARLEMPHVEVEFIKEYWHDVFVPFLEAYQSGNETPNPDVACNRVIKFHALRQHVLRELGVDYLATGHYARIRHMHEEHGDSGEGEKKVELLRGFDESKDQSYFLCMTPGEALSNVLFPLGSLRKSQVRQLAAEPFRGLAVLTKPESMGVCFIGKRDFGSFLSDYLTLTPGVFVDIDTGLAVGRHDGKEKYTVGQGARIGGTSQKYFVVSTSISSSSFGRAKKEALLIMERKKNMRKGDVLVAKGSTHPALFSNSLLVRANSLSWIAQAPPEPLAYGKFLRCYAKARYRQPLAACVVEAVPASSQLLVTFDVPQRAITAGQVLAMYKDAEYGQSCLGGGIIDVA